MTHFGPIPESFGKLGSTWYQSTRPCPHCNKSDQHVYSIWESSDGAYEDEKHICHACGHVWWIDGIDS